MSIHNNSNHTAILKTPFGKIKISADNRYLKKIEFLTDDLPVTISKEPVIHQFINELQSYLKDSSFKFSVPYQITGTSFQKRVWNALSNISLGKTVTYGELAQQLKTGPRAIGQACRTNPLPLIIPCHRVLSQQGLGGFDGDQTGKKIAIKQWLLNHEAYNSI